MGRNNDVEQVRRLQQFLNSEMNAGLPVTGFFGPLTDAAVRAFQAKYASEILTPWGINEPTGYVYLTTRKKINEMYCRGTMLFPLTPSELQVIERSGGEVQSTSASTPSALSEMQSPPRGSPQGAEEEDIDTVSSIDASDLLEATTATSGGNVVSDTSWQLGILLLVLAGFGVGWYFWSRPVISIVPPPKT
jgi:hypothetical protein